MTGDRYATARFGGSGPAGSGGATAALASLARSSPGRGTQARPGNPGPAPAPPDELELICTTAATATIREGIDGRRQFLVHGPLKDLDGQEIGTFRGVYQAKVFSQSDLLDHPEPPVGPFDRPYAAGEPEWTPPMNPAKSEWTFDVVGHVIRGAGLGLSRIALLPGGGTAFWFGVTSFVSWRRESVVICVGQATSQAKAIFPTTPALLDGMSFPTSIVHVLSLVSQG